MRSTSTYRTRRKGRTTGRAVVSGTESRRLIQLGVSLVIFLLALLGRNTSPQRAEQWKDSLAGDIDLKAALARFEDSSARGEPFWDALGELCVEVVTAEGIGEDSGAKNNREIQWSGLIKDASEWSVRRKSWNEFRESQWNIGREE